LKPEFVVGSIINYFYFWYIMYPAMVREFASPARCNATIPVQSLSWLGIEASDSATLGIVAENYSLIPRVL
jgi:hypothetical protein